MAALSRDIPIEYEPKKIKMAITGNGIKEQVAKMLQQL
jgi:crossover junction endodeoxyribonuclease RuvC